MELLLVLVVCGIFVLLARPLKDWYVLDVHDASGVNTDKLVFNDLDAAQRAFDAAVAAGAQNDISLEVHLWQVEARSRKEALRSRKGMALAPVLLKSTMP